MLMFQDSSTEIDLIVHPQGSKKVEFYLPWVQVRGHETRYGVHGDEQQIRQEKLEKTARKEIDGAREAGLAVPAQYQRAESAARQYISVLRAEGFLGTVHAYIHEQVSYKFVPLFTDPAK